MIAPSILCAAARANTGPPLLPLSGAKSGTPAAGEDDARPHADFSRLLAAVEAATKTGDKSERLLNVAVAQPTQATGRPSPAATADVPLQFAQPGAGKAHLVLPSARTLGRASDAASPAAPSTTPSVSPLPVDSPTLLASNAVPLSPGAVGTPATILPAMDSVSAVAPPGDVDSSAPLPCAVSSPVLGPETRQTIPPDAAIVSSMDPALSLDSASASLVEPAASSGGLSAPNKGKAAPNASALAPSAAQPRAVLWSPIKVLSTQQSPQLSDRAAPSQPGSVGDPAPAEVGPSPLPRTPPAAARPAEGTGTDDVRQSEAQPSDMLSGDLREGASAASLGLQGTASPVGAAELTASFAPDVKPAAQTGAAGPGRPKDLAPVQTNVAATGLLEAAGAAPTPGAQPASAAPATPQRAASLADQVAPSVAAMIQGRAPGRVLSISLAPDDLGVVSITVSRAADGTAVIQLGADRMSTLEMLHKDQTELARALDQAGVGQGSHSLSFAWNGTDAGSNGAGMQGWSDHRDRPGQQAQFVQPAPEEPGSFPAGAADNGGVDVTA